MMAEVPGARARGALRCSLALALALFSPGSGAAADDVSPDPSAPSPEAPPSAPGPPLRFRADFRAGWNITDGAGVIDHIVLEGTFGVQLGPRDVRINVAPVFAAAGGIAEGGEPTMRMMGGLEFAFALHPVVELVPAVFVGGFRAWEGDKRQGLAARIGCGLRVHGPRGFFVGFDPFSLYVLPPPPGGTTPYTSHVALDVSILRFGGRTP